MTYLMTTFISVPYNFLNRVLSDIFYVVGSEITIMGRRCVLLSARALARMCVFVNVCRRCVELYDIDEIQRTEKCALPEIWNAGHLEWGGGIPCERIAFWVLSNLEVIRHNNIYILFWTNFMFENDNCRANVCARPILIRHINVFWR